MQFRKTYDAKWKVVLIQNPHNFKNMQNETRYWGKWKITQIKLKIDYIDSQVIAGDSVCSLIIYTFENCSKPIELCNQWVSKTGSLYDYITSKNYVFNTCC